MRRRFILIFFTVFMIASVLSVHGQIHGLTTASQSLDSLIMVQGQLRDVTTGVPIPYAHIINPKFKRVEVSDTLGFFTIPMRKTDTLLITAIGYEDTRFTLPGFWPANHYSGVIYVKEKIYHIEGVTVHGLGTYEQFKQKVLSLDLSKDKVIKMQNYYDKILTEEAIKYQKVSTGFSFSLRTPEERSLKKLAKVEEEQKKQDLIDSKFNKAIISQLTGLHGSELEKFMRYCQLPEDFILKSPEYDILVRVKDLYENYKLLQSKNNN